RSFFAPRPTQSISGASRVISIASVTRRLGFRTTSPSTETRPSAIRSCARARLFTSSRAIRARSSLCDGADILCLERGQVAAARPLPAAEGVECRRDDLATVEPGFLIHILDLHLLNEDILHAEGADFQPVIQEAV